MHEATEQLRQLELTVLFDGSDKGNIKRILWNKLSNFHDVSWLYQTNSVLNKTGGDAFSIGATRTYNIGRRGTETVTELSLIHI